MTVALTECASPRAWACPPRPSARTAEKSLRAATTELKDCKAKLTLALAKAKSSSDEALVRCGALRLRRGGERTLTLR